MTRILLVKTSSLGDVIHCLPAVTDLARATPDLSLEWVVEEQFADIPRLHPAVTRIIPTRQRVWRRRPFAPETQREFGAMRRAMGEAPYDRIIDAQGLIRTAVLARLAMGPHCGYDARSVREPPASLFYDRRYSVSVTIHAVERMRSLVAQAMGHRVPPDLDYGLRAPSSGLPWLVERPYVVGLHATARSDKAWAEAHWVRLAQRAIEGGYAVVLPWGDEAERERSARIAEAAPGAVLPPKLSLGALAALFSGAAAVAGVDTGLTHLASALGAPVVAIYAASWSEFNGVIGPAHVSNLGSPGEPPAVDEVWDALSGAITSGRRTGAWTPRPTPSAPDLSSRRRFRPSNARAVVHRS